MPTALTIRQIDGKPGKVYYPLELISQPSPQPSTPTDLIIRISAAALNHRDLFIRQHLYPGVTFSVPLLADGCGVVIATGSDPSAQRWLHRRVILNPGTGWRDDPDGPEDPRGYAIQGATKFNPVGTAAEVVRIAAAEVEEAPEHLGDVEAAALPLTGLTAWRALVSKSGNAAPGRNVLVTGIGGGVALMVLLFAAGMGVNVYVTSGSEEKLRRAKELGAKGGVVYKEKGWEKKLLEMLPKERRVIDAIIDGAGGDIMDKAVKLLKVGGVVVQYGMTVSPKMSWSMQAVLKNIELRGSTMGSRKEFADMVAFVNEKGLRPVISKVAHGLDNTAAIEDLFDEMKKGSQFGKLVIDEIGKGGAKSKL
ncbi:NAD(P)-binding protein [Viridothelium virens]|uniref:NAD(P)-binding protein n=1 Tax=Viridothelium virens TaxID=1048519 RepID=A0A6A6HQJ7_VIRVR|nr:NAD(P)-binding protein [Viridothelium virens]